jgi:hypothetical protein
MVSGRPSADGHERLPSKTRPEHCSQRRTSVYLPIGRESADILGQGTAEPQLKQTSACPLRLPLANFFPARRDFAWQESL